MKLRRRKVGQAEVTWSSGKDSEKLEQLTIRRQCNMTGLAKAEKSILNALIFLYPLGDFFHARLIWNENSAAL